MKYYKYYVITGENSLTGERDVISLPIRKTEATRAIRRHVDHGAAYNNLQIVRWYELNQLTFGLL